MTNVQPNPSGSDIEPVDIKSAQVAAGFDWGVYANATMAGLAVLVPIPILDWMLEEFFRRRMPKAIAHQHRYQLSTEVVTELNRGDSERGWLATCLLLPIKGLFILIKRISKKILYFLTIKEASDQVSLYWHQAFLMDYMLMRGHLTDVKSAKAARQAMWQVIETTHRSPLLQLSQQIVGGTGHILRSLLKFRRGHEDELVQRKKEQMTGRWAEFQAYFEALAALYDQTYQGRIKALRQPPMITDS